MAEIFHPFENNDPVPEPDSGNSKPKGQGLSPFALVGAVLGALILLGTVAYFAFGLNTPAKTQGLTIEKNDVKSQLSADSVIFASHLLNMSYTTFKDERRAAEKYMNEKCLSEYQSVIYDTQFTDQIANGYLSTNYRYSEVIPVKYKDPEGTLWPAVKVIGVINYTSTKKNVSVEMPITLTIVWDKDKNGTYKVDNILMTE